MEQPYICPAARTRVFQGTTDHYRNKEKSCRHRKTYDQTTIVSDFSRLDQREEVLRGWPLPHTNNPYTCPKEEIS